MSDLPPEALYQLGLRYVAGDGVVRDWRKAREIFDAASASRHADATRVYASLVAMGAAAQPDWNLAVKILERAAAGNASVEEELALIKRLDFTRGESSSQPVLIKPIAVSPYLAIAEQLLTPDECAHIRKLAAPHLRPSVVVDAYGNQHPHPIRTSDGAVLGPVQQDLVVHAVNKRIATATGTAIEQGEPLTVLRYTPGQQYRLHHDCLPNEKNQRVMTAIIYLNEDFGGGATTFEALNRSIKPAAGDAIIFVNTLASGRPDERSRHAGLSVTRGEKWIATRWIRHARFDPWGLYG